MNTKLIVGMVVIVLIAVFVVWQKGLPGANTVVSTPTPVTELPHADLIHVTSPEQNATVGHSFEVSGEARGNWYFEASFPIHVEDASGKVIVSTHAQAQGEWMTTTFVPFATQITIPSTVSGPLTLVLAKDNPSGLPEHDASVRIPITISH